MKIVLAFAAMLQLIASCVPAVDQNAPDAHVPPLYRDQASAGTSSLGDLGWWQLFKDPVLIGLIKTALANNYNAQIAAERVIQAQEQYTITNAARFPLITGSLAANYSGAGGQKAPGAASNTFSPQAMLNASYELDLFGKLRNASAAARAQILASEDARQAVIVALVSSVATQYMTLLELDEELAIAKRTVAGRERQLSLNKLRNSGGVGTLQDVNQAEQLLAGAQAVVPTTQLAITQTEDSISTLIGGYPAPVPRGLALEDQVAMPQVPDAGLPSSLLERRPDIRGAEQQLLAARAQVAVARAMLFPQVTLGGSGGVGWTSLNGIFYGPQGLFSIAPQLVQPIFNAGSLQAGVRQNQSIERQQVLTYLQTVETGFQNVSDALVAYDQDRLITAQLYLVQESSNTSTSLAVMRFRGGVTNYLEVLVSEQNSFTAELQFARAELAERLAIVQLYQALGGGWQTPPPS
jgi:multidrug efflux system outer membrane protein